ncbi:hypothetical protein BAE44_0021275 [Dichanthelium oligosanthes]|uniref:Uncharacterized protein n=1 Tax=Dichanthelium oligosanthes TaxID=888268 RepID=A0A1E5UXU2_9POAL|nr:hypothetical protein BAE44_0021275 [Dichanthelium oligosanthes]
MLEQDLYGPHDHVVHVKLAPASAGGTIINHQGLALEVLMAMASSLNITALGPEIQELKQLAADESYYGYSTVSEYLMLRAFGWGYFHCYRRGSADQLSVRLDPSFGYHPYKSAMHESISEASKQGKRYLLLVENLHFPVSLDLLAFITNKQPSLVHNQWIISATSKNVFDKSKSRQAAGALDSAIYAYSTFFHVGREYYHALTFDDLDKRDWCALIKEALQDAASSIHNTLQLEQQRDHKFWLRISQHCLYYGILYHPLQVVAEHQKSTATITISSDELVRCWVAEKLMMSSVTSPSPIIPGTTVKKQSNYRSAYEAGKVVIQALQEYSLLPRSSSISTKSGTPRTATTSASFQDDVTGVAMLAEDVPRLKQDELFVPHNKRGLMRWVSFMDDDGRHVSCDWIWREEMKTEFIPGEMTMSTLILRGYSDISGFPFDQVLNSHIHVLDLSYTTIESIPSSFSCLLNLYLLSLRGCSKLETLSPPPSTSEHETPPPFAHLGNLEVLDMNGVSLLELTQQDFNNKGNLHYLDLSGSRIATCLLNSSVAC